MGKKSVASITLVASLAIVLSGCSFPGMTTTQETSMMTSDDTTVAGNQIAAAMMSGGSLKCEVTNATTGDSFTYTIKGEKIRASIMTSDTTQPDGNMINDTEYIYVWNNDENTGVKMRALTQAEMQDAAAQAPTTSIPDFSSDEVQQQYQDQGYTMTCQEALVTDADFIPPATVTFQDMSAMMDAAMQQGQQLQMQQTQVQMQGSAGVGAGTPGNPGY